MPDKGPLKQVIKDLIKKKQQPDNQEKKSSPIDTLNQIAIIKNLRE